MRTEYLVFVTICLVGLGTRTGYELLKKKGKIDPESRIVFVVVFAAMVLMLGSWVFMCQFDPWQIAYPDAIRMLGLAALASGVGLAAAGLVQLKGLENIDHLVSTGIYSKIRHPMYSGFILWIIGWVLFYGAAMTLIIAVIGIANILYWRKLEQDKMIETYGDAYRDYMKGTWL